MTELDYEKTIFIVDSYTTAFMISIIAKKNPIKCIYEYKEGFSQLYNNIYVEVLSNTIFSNLEEITVKQKFFLINKKKPFKSIYNIFKFKNQHKHLKIDKDCIYVGSSTSVILSFVEESKRYYLDHGTGDYLSRTKKNSFEKIKSTLNNILLTFGFFSIFKETKKNGFTLCKMKNDTFTHIDATKYEIPQVLKEKLNGVIEFVDKYQKRTLILPTSNWHNKDGVDGNTSIYDELNIKMCEDSCLKDELLILKFHPSLRMAKNINITLIDKLEERGYKVLILDSLLPEELQYYLPAEIFINILNIKKIVTEESSVLFNHSHLNGFELIGYPYLFDAPCHRNGLIINVYKTLDKFLIHKPSIDYKILLMESK